MKNSFFILCLAFLSACNGGGGGSSSSSSSTNFQSNDPLFSQQWHLKNTGQTSFAKEGGTKGIDINLAEAASSGLTGNGVRVGVSDSGIEITHEDLNLNYDLSGSKNFNSSTPYSGDPIPFYDSPSVHGTAVTGIIAASGDNSMGGRGIAPSVKFGGFNFLASGVSQSLDQILMQMTGPFDLFNYSYGSNPFQYRPFGSPTSRTAIVNAYKEGVSTGRSGQGFVYVKSAGNEFEGSIEDDTGISSGWAQTYLGNSTFLESNNYPYTIIAGAINAKGTKSSYSNPGSNLWISAPGGEYGLGVDPTQYGLSSSVAGPAIVTTDLSGCSLGNSKSSDDTNKFENGSSTLNSNCNYTSTMNGTSSAAPVVTGVVALILEANPDLSWRDVKHILATTARIVDSSSGSYTHPLGKDLAGHIYQQKWVKNAAGFNFHNYYGFGLIDASAATKFAKNYDVDLGEFKETINSNTGDWIYDSGSLSLSIPNQSATGVSHSINVKHNFRIEGIQIKASINHEYIDNIGLELTSPSGTKSIILNINSNTLDLNLTDALLLSNAFYGEHSSGTWTIKVIDGLDINPDGTSGSVGQLVNWKINILGHTHPGTEAPLKVPSISNESTTNSLTSSPNISWTDSPSTNILRYEYCIGTSSDTCNIYDWTSNGMSTSLLLTDLSLSDAETYFINVRVVNSTENVSEITSSSWTVVNPNTTGSSSGGTSTGETTTGGTTTGGTTTGGTTTGGTTTGGATTGGTTTGGATTGGTTTGGTTTGGTWTSISTVGAPSPRYLHSAVWTGTEMIIWGGTEEYIQGTTPKTRLAISGGRYNPTTNSWLPMRDAPLTRREGYSILWTGTHLIVYGGTLPSQSTESGWVSGPTNTGAIYDPITDTWTGLPITSVSRTGHSAFWAGNKMLIWGGSIANPNWPYNTPTTSEDLFNVSNFQWTNLQIPSDARVAGPAMWTGSELIIWGGAGVGGGFYNPNTNAWVSISEFGAPGLGSLFWTGNKMIVWGPGQAGGIYNSLSDSWSQISITGAINGKAVWAGSELIVWDSFNKKSSAFDPDSNSWRKFSEIGAPTARYNDSLTWTGTQLIIWGGLNSSTSKFEKSGGKFNP